MVDVVVTGDAALMMMYMQFFLCISSSRGVVGTNSPKVTSPKLRVFAHGRCGSRSKGCTDDVHAVHFFVSLWFKVLFPQSDVP